MKLSVKMPVLFSIVLVLGMLILSSIAIRSSVEDANAFAQARFRNMSTSIRRDLEQDFTMMEITLQELTENTTFMAALNQIVRDDSVDQKMALAAGRSAVNQMNQSPLVDAFYRVTFYTRDGVFLTTFVDSQDRESTLTTNTDEALERIASLSWLDDADEERDAIPLAPHEDILSVIYPVQVYGVAQQIQYHGKAIGYLEIANRYEDLSRILDYVDNPDVCVEVIFDDGERLYESQEAAWTWPDTLSQDEYAIVETAEGGTSRAVYHSHLGHLGLHLYISQDSVINERNNAELRTTIYRQASLIMLPALALIVLMSLGLTRSINRLSRKVKRIPADSVLRLGEAETGGLLATVTSPRDPEAYELEQSLNQLMRRLQESATNEMSLREGTLQAQLSALQTQINPHFIYNTLNIISAKSMESGNFDVIEICDQFAQMLRYSTDTRSKTATMAEEIDNVRNYLMLAKARYEDNLEFTIDVPENLGSITVPKLTLQPLVENAMTHGFDGRNVQRNLRIIGRISGETLILEIRDNGTGFSDEMLMSLRARIREIDEGKVGIASSGGHIGLINTCLRLHYYSQGAMRIAIRNENGAVITISMPCGKAESPA